MSLSNQTLDDLLNELTAELGNKQIMKDWEDGRLLSAKIALCATKALRRAPLKLVSKILSNLQSQDPIALHKTLKSLSNCYNRSVIALSFDHHDLVDRDIRDS